MAAHKEILDKLAGVRYSEKSLSKSLTRIGWSWHDDGPMANEPNFSAFEVPDLPRTDEEFESLPILTLPEDSVSEASADRTDSTEASPPQEVAPVGGELDSANSVETEDDTSEGYADENSASDDFSDVSREGDPIGVVVPGDGPNDGAGLSSLVVRSINGQDHGHYDENYVNLVKKRQEQAGLEQNGVVCCDTWALVLRNLRFGASGHEVRILRCLLGLPGVGKFDQAVEDALDARFEFFSGTVDRDVWFQLISAAIDAQDASNPPESSNQDA